MSNPLAGQQEHEITLPGTWSPVAVAVDWVGDKLYVADSVGQKIDCFELDGRLHVVVLGSNLTNPTDIAVDSTSGLMFIADSSQVIYMFAFPASFNFEGKTYKKNCLGQVKT